MNGPSRRTPELRDDLLRAVIDSVAEHGVANTIRIATSEGLDGHSSADIETDFGGAETLVLEVAVALAAAPVLSRPPADAAPTSLSAVVERFAFEHRAYVAEDRARFAAIVQLASAGSFGHRELAVPLARRNRETKGVVRAWLSLLRRRGLTALPTVDLSAIAEVLVDTFTGAEMCHLLDGDAGLLDSAYRLQVESTVARLDPSVRPIGPAPTLGDVVFEDDYRMRFVLDPDGVVVDVLEVTGVVGWTSRIMMGRRIADVAAESSGPEDRAALWAERIEQAHSDPCPVVHPDLVLNQPTPRGELASCTLIPVHSRSGELDAIMVEIEHHAGEVAREETRREIEHQLRNAVELTGLGSYVAYIREPRIDSDARFDEIYGINPQVLMEQEGFDGFFDVMHAEDAPKVRLALEAAMSGEVDYIASYRLWARRPDGPELRWIEALGRVESDEHGPLRVIGVIEDVTDRRIAQDRQLRTQKREAIGTLTAGIAHDFNNVIGAVLANAVAAQNEYDAGESPQISIHEIERGARRAGALVERLLAFSRDEEPQKVPFDLAQVVDEACALIRPTLGSDVELRQTLPTELPRAVGDATQLHQVLINLIVNADHAIGPRPGTIDVSLDTVIRTGPAAESLDGLPAGEYLCLQVSDDGPGVPERIVQRIFDPFFTTSPAGGNTGLGLSSTQAIVSNHGGAITVERSEAGGALFTVLLPCVAAGAPRVPLPPDVAWRRRAVDPRSAVEAGLARILFVDDEEALSRVARRAMPSRGFDAVTFSDPVAALEAFRGDPDGFDAVITDLAMPTMNGLDFIREVRELRPSVPVVLTSGFLTNDTREEARRQRVGHVVAKPWSVDELADKTLELIDRRDGPKRR